MKPSLETDSSTAGLSLWRAWWFLLRFSIRRQARAHLLVWVSLGLLALTCFIVQINTRFQRWEMSHWRYPRREGLPHAIHVLTLDRVSRLPWLGTQGAPVQAIASVYAAQVYQGAGLWIFSTWVVFSIFTSFLLPLWTLSFATEALGRERENRTLLWLLVRPLPRPLIYLGKYLAALPWCLLLNVGGFFLICQLGGMPGRTAFGLYWPAVLVGTMAFASLFHFLGAWFRRAAVLAVLYAFFLETIAGNLPGHFKRLSLSYYVRCLMFERAQDFGITPDRPWIFLPVEGSTALAVLLGVTALFLALGMWLFARKEYGELA